MVAVRKMSAVRAGLGKSEVSYLHNSQLEKPQDAEAGKILAF